MSSNRALIKRKDAGFTFANEDAAIDYAQKQSHRSYFYQRKLDPHTGNFPHLLSFSIPAKPRFFALPKLELPKFESKESITKRLRNNR